MYRLFRHYLGDNFTEPPGISHHIASVRLVDMYTKCQEKDVKEEIIQKDFGWEMGLATACSVA